MLLHPVSVRHASRHSYVHCILHGGAVDMSALRRGSPVILQSTLYLLLPLSTCEPHQSGAKALTPVLRSKLGMATFAYPGTTHKQAPAFGTLPHTVRNGGCPPPNASLFWSAKRQKYLFVSRSGGLFNPGALWMTKLWFWVARRGCPCSASFPFPAMDGREGVQLEFQAQSQLPQAHRAAFSGKELRL